MNHEERSTAPAPPVACFVCMGGENTLDISVASVTEPYALECNISYFAEVMEKLRYKLPRHHDYTFVFTRSVDELPAKFENLPKLVVFVMGDEWARIPRYASSVHAVFKAPGQQLKIAPHRGWLRFNLTACLLHLRKQTKRFPNYWHDSVGNVFSIPYGYYRLPKRSDVKPINDRTLDVSFMGSVDHSGLRERIKTTKILSRERMLSVLREWDKKSPFSAYIQLSSYFPHAKQQPEHGGYPQVLMDTKICLAPRGTHLETFRLGEGTYYGCVVIAEEQPEHWFAESSPALIINDWSKLPELLDALLSDPEQLANRQRQSLAYWDRMLSPDAVAAYIAHQLDTLSDRPRA